MEKNIYRQNLKFLKKSLHLSSSEMAEILNVPSRTINSYEYGERTPSLDFLSKLCNKFNINANWFILEQGSIFNPDYSGERQNDTTVIEKSSQFGKRVAELQAKHNFLNREMAKLLNISESHYMKLVIGKVDPDLKILNCLKQNFKVSIDYLLYGD